MTDTPEPTTPAQDTSYSRIPIEPRFSELKKHAKGLAKTAQALVTVGILSYTALAGYDYYIQHQPKILFMQEFTLQNDDAAVGKVRIEENPREITAEVEVPGFFQSTKYELSYDKRYGECSSDMSACNDLRGLVSYLKQGKASPMGDGTEVKIVGMGEVDIEVTRFGMHVVKYSTYPNWRATYPAREHKALNRE